jgi:hypothetical protein
MSELNLYQKLLKITEEVGMIKKSGTNLQQNYKFIESAMVVAEVRVQLAKYGVMIIPETVERNIERNEVIRANGKTGVDFHVTVKSAYTIINADNPEERTIVDWDGGEAIDSSDKASNKAITASHKSFLMKLFNISDKDDPDTDSPTIESTPAVTPKPAYKAAGPFKKIEPVEKEAEPTKISEVSKTKVRQAFHEKGISGLKVTDYCQFIIGKNVPETEEDATKLLEALSLGDMN